MSPLSTLKIQKIVSREVLDSRGYPTVEAELSLDDPRHPGEVVMGRAIVPSGASTGEGEAIELRDGDKTRYLGKGVRKAVENVRTQIAPKLVGRAFGSQAELDEELLALDGTPNKGKLGANAILAVSMAFMKAVATARRLPTYRIISEIQETKGVTLPVPLMNIINGGKHADNGLAIQEFMIVPAGLKTFSEAFRAGAEVFHHLKQILHQQGLSTGVGDEGGFAPVFNGANPHEQAIQVIMKAIETAGYKAGRDIYLALDCASSEFGKGKDGAVEYLFEGRKLTAGQMVDQYSQWLEKYPIISIEDGLSEHDWTGWAQFTSRLGSRLQLVGDDLFVTNPEYLKQGIAQKSANAILIKLNQIGTVTETLETMKMAAHAGFGAISSHRSGESEDTFIADLAVGTDCGQIKTGSASRTDRIAKYNQLIRIEEELGTSARYAGPSIFVKGL